VTQLQNVINNFDPLHLTTGNPNLKQTYRHNLTIRYNSTSKDAKQNFSALITGNYGQNNIVSNSIIAARDTPLQQNIVLHQGSQLTVPVNMDGHTALNTSITYGLPVAFIKSRLSMTLHGSIAHVPGQINGAPNFQETRTGGFGLSVSSNISENVDFTISSNTDATANTNSISTASNTQYVSENAKASLNLITPGGFVFYTMVTYQTNTGLSEGYNKDFLLWNVALGKKFLKKRQADIRLAAFDILNQNKDITHIVNDLYVQDIRTNILQRYFLLVFTYKINSFKGAKDQAKDQPAQ
jgi:hypothetical protein